jgi:hypothetical protein
MASSRKSGTNEHISTYGNATRNYTSLATWEADTDNDLVTLAKSEVLECYDDAASFNDCVTLDGTITNASYFRIIRPASGQGHDGTPNNGVWFNSTTNADLFTISESFTSIQDIIGTLTINGTTDRNVFVSTVDNGHFAGDIAWNGNNAGTGGIYGFNAKTAVNGTIFINCLAKGNETRGFNAIAITGATSYFYNCTAYGNNNGFVIGSAAGTGTTVWTNCLSTANTSHDFIDTNTGANVITATYNASGDATADDWGGAGNRINQTFTFANTAIDDYHLASNDAGARNYGTDLSSNPGYPFNDDIDKQTRPGETAWDIGADEYVPAVGGFKPYWFHNSNIIIGEP